METFYSEKNLCENVSVGVIYLLKFILVQKYVKNRNNFHCRRHSIFVRKSSAKTSMILTSPSNV